MEGGERYLVEEEEGAGLGGDELARHVEERREGCWVDLRARKNTN